MGQRILYQNDDGGISIIIPGSGAFTIDEIARKDVPGGRNYVIVADSAIPGDRYFRNAWELNGNGIAVNMDKAIEIQKDVLRAERQPLLDALDIEYMKALETKDEVLQAEIAAKKQVLRDITQNDLLASAKTPDLLKVVTVEKVLEASGYKVNGK